MKFQELKQSLKLSVSPIYLINGEDEFLKTSAKNLILNAVIGDNSINLVTLNMEDIDSKKLIDTLNTFSFFGKKVVILNECDKKDIKFINAIKDYAKQPNNECVLVIMCILNTNFDSLKDCTTFIDCNRLDNVLLAKWIVHKINGKKQISNQTIYKLIDYTNGYLGRIDLELNKLMGYSNETILDEDVEKLVVKDIEYSIFELAESLGRKNKTKALNIFNDLINDKKQSSSVLQLIANHFRRLFYVSVSKDTNEQIGEYLGIKPYAVKKLKEQQLNFSPKKLMEIIRECEEIDVASKTGKVNYYSSMNLFMTKLLSKM